MAALSDNHRRALSAALSMIDDRLVEVLGLARGEYSALSRYADDLTPAQARTIEDYIAQLRARIGEVLAMLDIPTTPPSASCC